jgi:hypothetical protein
MCTLPVGEVVAQHLRHFTLESPEWGEESGHDIAEGE